MSDFTNVAEQTLPGGQGIGAPASGSYGEKASLDRLQKSLPKAQTVSPGAETGAPVAPLPRTSPAASGGDGGVPPSILAPSSRPDVPAMTPLAQPAANPMADAATWRQRNLAMLDALANDPTRSPVTREWASQALDKLVRASVR